MAQAPLAAVGVLTPALTACWSWPGPAGPGRPSFSLSTHAGHAAARRGARRPSHDGATRLVARPTGAGSLSTADAAATAPSRSGPRRCRAARCSDRRRRAAAPTRAGGEPLDRASATRWPRSPGRTARAATARGDRRRPRLDAVRRSPLRASGNVATPETHPSSRSQAPAPSPAAARDRSCHDHLVVDAESVGWPRRISRSVGSGGTSARRLP